MSLVVLNGSKIPSSPSSIHAPSGGQSGECDFLRQPFGPREDFTELQNVGPETLVVDVCGFLASPCPFTPFPVTASNVCGGTTLPHLQVLWFLWCWQYLSITPHSRDGVWPGLGMWSRASGSPVVSDWFRGRHISQGRQIRANPFHFGGLSGLLGLPSDPDWNHGEVGWSWGCHLANSHSWKCSQQAEQQSVKWRTTGFLWPLLNTDQAISKVRTVARLFIYKSQCITFFLNSLNQFELDFLSLATKSWLIYNVLEIIYHHILQKLSLNYLSKILTSWWQHMNWGFTYHVPRELTLSVSSLIWFLN